MTYRVVRRFLAEVLGLDEALISPDTRLWREVDVVCLAKVVIACEQRFRITIHDEQVAGFARVRDPVRHIDDCRAEGRDDYTLPSDVQREAWYYE